MKLYCNYCISVFIAIFAKHIITITFIKTFITMKSLCTFRVKSYSIYSLINIAEKLLQL